MKKIAILIMVITIFSKILGFIRDIIISYFYGASNISDAYFVSMIVPGTVAGFIGIGISTGYIPIYNKIQSIEGAGIANKFTNNLISALFIIYSFIFFISFTFSKEIVGVFASGFDHETLQLSVQFTRITLVGMYIIGITHVIKGYLQIKGSYSIPELAIFPMNIITIISVFLSYHYSIAALAYGRVLALVAQLLFMLSFAYKKGFKYIPTLSLKDKHLKSMLMIGLPIMLGVSINQINVLVDKTLASQIAVGGITALTYSSRLNEFIQGIFVLSISTALYPLISKMAALNDMNGIKKYTSDAIISINILIVPVAIGSMVLAEPIVKMVYGRGAFDESAVLLTSQALFFYSIGMIGFGMREIISRVFYSLQNTKIPMINASIGMMLNIILNIVLSHYLGIGGLALATSISAIFTSILLFFSLRKRIGAFGLKNILATLSKIIIASIIMGLAVREIYQLLSGEFHDGFALLFSITIGVFIYLVLIYFLKINEFKVFIKILIKKVFKKGL
ncbi:murein biosynthesis integral membrane protein MurJ [Planococcus plakortidis]|uniref:murein biosynthesis integral membrane protein MurJ n=1 Tax=Planococcus plakortidis TaxID=1038856 RepID=UPI0038600217